MTSTAGRPNRAGTRSAARTPRTGPAGRRTRKPCGATTRSAARPHYPCGATSQRSSDLISRRGQPARDEEVEQREHDDHQEQSPGDRRGVAEMLRLEPGLVQVEADGLVLG